MALYNNKKPNFFIVGAPKCGTTALVYYLKTHPNIFIPDLKEPHYFCSDFYVGRNIESWKEYEKLFQGVSKEHKAIGEASVWYSYSNVALKKIHNFNPLAKIIIMLRNPIDLVQSLHSQQLYSFQENKKSFAKAWGLAEERCKGNKMPKTCYVPQMIDYKKIGMLSEQLEKALNIFPKKQVLIILFDDFVSDTKKVYESVLFFLNLKSDNKKIFPIINQRKAYRSIFLARILNNHGQALRYFLLRIPIIRKKDIVGHLLKFNLYTGLYRNISHGLQKELRGVFKNDIKKLSKILNRNLDSWIN